MKYEFIHTNILFFHGFFPALVTIFQEMDAVWNLNTIVDHNSDSSSRATKADFLEWWV